MMLIIHSSSPASARTAKPPLRSGDDAVEDSILNRRVIKKPRFQVRSDIQIQSHLWTSTLELSAQVIELLISKFTAKPDSSAAS